MKSKLKKALIAMITAFSLAMPTASAKVVTVDGTGITEDAAIKDAKRIAVEQVAGTSVRAISLTVDLELVFDAINSRTQGYVNSCKVLSKKYDGDVITVTAQVDVSDEPSSSLMKDVEVVMALNDPRLAVVTEHYGDDGGEMYKRYAVMCTAAIREELVKHGFTHVVDNPVNVDYVVLNNLTVGKGRAISIPSWASISNNNMTKVETGLSKYEAIMDGKIKRTDTDEIVGEFHSSGENINLDEGSLDNQAVAKLAANAAQEVRNIFDREARKVFTSVKVIAQGNNGGKVLQLEEYLRQTSNVSSVYVRSFAGGKCVMDVGTDFSPQNLYRALEAVVKDDLNITLQGFSSTVLEVSIN